jgi:thiosulfate/3-mercaptopyruvate sulfurtransferase
MYAKDVLVDPQWLHDRRRDPWIRVVEVDARADIPGAIALDRRELQEPIRRDVLGPDAFGDLLGSRGISDEHAIVLCGDGAAYAYWCLRYYGHVDAKLLDGPAAAVRSPAVAPESFHARSPDQSIRALRYEVMAALENGTPLIDARSPRDHAAGHVPGAASIPWRRAVREDGRFRSVAELEAIYPDDGEPVIAYCRSGERSAHTWFVLHELLGRRGVKNYDWGWTEWGNLVGVPVCASTSTPARPICRPTSHRSPAVPLPRPWN